MGFLLFLLYFAIGGFTGELLSRVYKASIMNSFGSTMPVRFGSAILWPIILPASLGSILARRYVKVGKE